MACLEEDPPHDEDLPLEDGQDLHEEDIANGHDPDRVHDTHDHARLNVVHLKGKEIEVNQMIDQETMN